jgi:hypothetical protein
MVECPGSFSVWPLLPYRHVRTGPIVEVHIMSGAYYEDVQKPNISHFTLNVAQMHVRLLGVCACVRSNGWRTGHYILLTLYHVVF